METILDAASQASLARCRDLIDSDPSLASFQAESNGRSALMAAAGAGSLECVQLLLERGAPWNALDREGKCAGEYAMESGSQACVDALVNAGVQAQLLFGFLDDETTTDDRTTEAYLKQDLSLDDESLIDSQGDAVMMEWERPLMQASADLLCGTSFPHEWCENRKSEEISALNVGHGMAIIDNYIREKRPRRHVIVEPHPTVLKKMKGDGWLDSCEVFQGTWQAFLETQETPQFDAIYFDTYAEKYSDMLAFFQALPRLLKPGGIFSFFNGCCPFNPFFHGVACQLIKVQIEALPDFQVDFVPIKVDPLPQSTWSNVKRRYWIFDSYHLPVVLRRRQRPSSSS